MRMTCKEFEASFESSTTSLAIIRDFIREVGRSACIDAHLLDDIELAVDEACTNIIEHAYDGLPGQSIHMRVEVDHETLMVKLLDGGKTFTFDEHALPEQSQLSSFTPGGRGLFLMHALLDDVRYRRAPEGQNELVLVKRLK
jgi:serine/threonine-protein kinase RsbW